MAQRQHAPLHRIGNRVRHRLRIQQLRQIRLPGELLVKRAHLHAAVRRRPDGKRAARHDGRGVNFFFEQPQFFFLQQRREQRLRAHREFLHLQCARLVHMQHQFKGVLHRRLRCLLGLALALVCHVLLRASHNP